SSSAASSKTQNDEKTTDAPKSSAKESATPTDKDSDSTITDKPSGSNKPSATNKNTSKKITDIDPRLPAGGVSMVTPAPIAGPQFYKIGEWVTFAWNYTSLSVPPKAIDILATCSANQATYTLAVNQTMKETGRVLWDTGAYQSSATVPLLTETYTLLIYDADSSVSATAKAGYLGVYNQFTFGMYTPQPYVDWKDFNCANCAKNAAGFLYDTLTLKMMVVSGATTVASFLYFANAFGLI
ncbi:hypothetical protein EJ04DRAFT_429718, partial [Polyplosphaeria fusca]